MTDGREIVRTLEQELDVTQQRCAQLERAIFSMREIYGIVGDIDDEEDIAPPAGTRRTKAGKERSKQASKQASKAKRVPVKTGGDFDGPHDLAVLRFVEKHPASRMGEVAAALDLKSWVLRASLDRLLKNKQVVIAGVGRGQRVSAKEAL
jgi:hypothetical protein